MIQYNSKFKYIKIFINFIKLIYSISQEISLELHHPKIILIKLSYS